jgi:hypothetical protein
LKEGRYTPEVFNDPPSNAFAGRDVTAIALQLPDAAFRSTRIGLWARISLCDHTPQRQVNRTGQAMFRPLFFNPPDSEAQLDTLNAALPAAGRECGAFHPGDGNGRALGDNAFDIAVAVLAGSPLGNASVPRPPTAEFPYLSAPRPADLPALADLFGLREQRPD